MICNRGNVRSLDCSPCTIQRIRSLTLVRTSAVSCACGDTKHRPLGYLFTLHNTYSSVLVIGRNLLASASVTGVTLSSNAR